MLLEQRQQFGVGSASENLGDEGPAGCEVFDREPRRSFDQAHGPQVIGLFVAHGVRRHVGQHEVRRPAERFGQCRGRVFGHEVHLQDRHAVDRLARQQVDADHRRLGCALANHLAPAARRDAEIDHAVHAFEQGEALIELDQLISRAAAIAFRLGLLDVRVIKLPFEPAGR